MRKVKKLPYLCFFALILPLLAVIFGAIFSGCEINDNKEIDYEHAFSVSKYDVTYDISKNCSIAVTEDITIRYEGRKSTGFMRDIPVNNGAQVRDVYVKKFVKNDFSSALEDVYFDVFVDTLDYLTVDIGSFEEKFGTEESYRITYTYVISNRIVNSGTLPLNPVGHGWQFEIRDISIKLILPKEAICTGTQFYYGETGETNLLGYSDSQEDGRTVITAEKEHLNSYEGITVYLDFEPGSIKRFTDFTPYLFFILGLVILGVVILLKLFCFNKNTLTPVVNFEAPNKMDPLLMGKLIDNKVNGEDITSLIYYFADKGYLKINLDSKDNPTIIRTVKNLPNSCPDYEKLMFNNLFRGEEMVKTSQLTNVFYRTVERMTAMVNAQTKGLYSSKSIGISIIFALLGGILLGLAPLMLAFFQISLKFLLIAPFVSLVPGLFIYALSETVKYNSLKFNRKKKALFILLISAIWVAAGAVYVIFVPKAVMGYLLKVLLWVVSGAIIACSVLIISRTDEYTQKLNDIVGFRNFILLAEKDRLEAMLEEDPQFYYHILPYAQVLGVSDKWEEKFKNLTVPPPNWATSSTMHSVFEFHVINSTIRHSMGKISSSMVSRPSSSGKNGGGRSFGGFGGGGGGFSGGGFGGGGGRGR